MKFSKKRGKKSFNFPSAYFAFFNFLYALCWSSSFSLRLLKNKRKEGCLHVPSSEMIWWRIPYLSAVFTHGTMQHLQLKGSILEYWSRHYKNKISLVYTAYFTCSHAFIAIKTRGCVFSLVHSQGNFLFYSSNSLSHSKWNRAKNFRTFTYYHFLLIFSPILHSSNQEPSILVCSAFLQSCFLLAIFQLLCNK